MTYHVLVRYREVGGTLQYEIVTGDTTTVVNTLMGYASTKDAHSLMILAVDTDDVVSHASSHENGGADEISVDDLSGLLGMPKLL